ncbi:urease accessory protein UreF [Leptolyngbya sp. FACHB-36]|uniref:urease accessory protein UreF n=1 Tax=Leptolyngbya sp. FACHB-36 TaxID=2692808 RepID=UPI001681AEFA|nr:urease accessory protein UreF [Leptolyngbya sp. FACHB-36]MBD2022513.1 urease accessory protein UreF [Leptolyngbya sp. FACHB-36]
MLNSLALLRLLQLASPALPIGAYSYSEGLEALVYSGKLVNAAQLEHWLTQELRYGGIRLEAAVMVRSYEATQKDDRAQLQFWNRWLSAARETEELRLQSWQMGRSLLRLFQDVEPQWADALLVAALRQENGCNAAIAFGLVAAYWQIDLSSALLGYLHSWATNLVGAGIKLIPLGQTAGQQTLLNLHAVLKSVAQEVLALDDDDLSNCGWGLAIASMTHETQYSRLFRS